MRSLLVAAASALALIGSALADQCVVLDVDQAAKLEALVKAKFNGVKELIGYCAPCGDAKAGPIPLDELADTGPDGDDFSSLHIGDQEYDAAYLYLPKEMAPPYRSAPSLASLIGCPVAADTPKAIDVAGDWSVAKPAAAQ